jgi:hypothetical protein
MKEPATLLQSSGPSDASQYTDPTARIVNVAWKVNRNRLERELRRTGCRCESLRARVEYLENLMLGMRL